MKDKLMLLVKKKRFWTCVIAVSFFIFVTCALLLVGKHVERKENEKVYDGLKNDYVTNKPLKEQQKQEQQSDDSARIGGTLEVDFETLQKVNAHTYAWLEVGGTDISYPVVQHPKSLSYYLDHTITNKRGLPGSIFSEYYTTTDLSDYVHIIYGHNMKDKSMFGALHNYEKEGYLEKYSYMYLYTPKYTYVYRIFATVVINEEHFLTKFDFSTTEGRSEYLNFLYNSREKSQKNHYLGEINVTTEQKFLILSTCTNENKHLRYTIHGALVEVVENNSK